MIIYYYNNIKIYSYNDISSKHDEVLEGGSVQVKKIKTAEHKGNVLRKDKPHTPSRKKIITGQNKAIIALEALKRLKTVDEIAQDFNVLPAQVIHWRNVLLKQAPKIFNINHNVPSDTKRQNTESR
jgi:hypothetical protein